MTKNKHEICTSVTISEVQNIDKSDLGQGNIASEILIIAQENEKSKSLRKTFWQIFTKPRILIPYDIATVLLGIYSSDLKIISTENPVPKCV